MSHPKLKPAAGQRWRSLQRARAHQVFVIEKIKRDSAQVRYAHNNRTSTIALKHFTQRPARYAPAPTA